VRHRALRVGDLRGGGGEERVSAVDIWPAYVDRVMSFIDVSALRPLKVVIDAANGMAGAMLPPVLERLPMIEAVRCYFDPDGSFPNHEPNCSCRRTEFIVRRIPRRAPTWGSRSTATPTAASSSTTAASSSRATCDGAARRVDPREGSGAKII
jgi:hypothetical protein